MRSSVVALVAIIAVAGLIMAGIMGADAHSGHVQKKLFTGRWYNASTMDLSTSQINNPTTLQCDGNFASCSSKWAAPIQGAVNQWNAQQDTADFIVQPDFNINYDIIVWVVDEISIIQPGILGLAVFYDVNGTECNPDNCSPPACVPGVTCNKYFYGDAVMGDDWHIGPYDGATSRQTTVVHELGHLLSLRHESVNAECGQDNTGPIPASIMAYDCINPVSVGGWGITTVQPFDVCGVNHAYPDGAFGFAGCPATPTPTPSPVPASPNAWGNVDCGGGIGSVDALKVLRYSSDLSVSQTEPPPCPDIGVVHPVVLTHAQGDIDCSGGVNSVDALKLLRFSASLSVSQTLPCPVIGVDP